MKRTGDLTPPTPDRIRFGGCELRTDTRELWRNGVHQHVRRRVFDLMVYLIAQRPRVVPHGELMQVIWHRPDASQTALARAVMEARQACAGAPGEPKSFVSVHGVGYRFAGELRAPAAPEPARQDTATAADAGREELRVFGYRAELALHDRRFESDQRLAADAATRAEMLGMRSEQARVLLRASMANRATPIPEAARLAHRALQLAKAEGDELLMAEALMATGALHVQAGDRELGMRQLRQAMEAFSHPGHEADLARCLKWQSRALHDQGELEAALGLCRRSVAVSRARTGRATQIVDQLDEMQLLTELGDRCAEAGDGQAAREHLQCGLAAGQSLLKTLQTTDLVAARAACLDRLCVLLERLDRLVEARDAARACDLLREGLPDGARWPDEEDRARLRMQRAWLALRSGQSEAALAQARETLATVASAPANDGLASLYRIGADIAARIGLHEQATQWLRVRCEVLVRSQRNRAASLAAILAAELNVQALRTELDRSRTEARDVLVENAQLRKRVTNLGGEVVSCSAEPNN